MEVSSMGGHGGHDVAENEPTPFEDGDGSIPTKKRRITLRLSFEGEDGVVPSCLVVVDDDTHGGFFGRVSSDEHPTESPHDDAIPSSILQEVRETPIVGISTGSTHCLAHISSPLSLFLLQRVIGERRAMSAATNTDGR